MFICPVDQNNLDIGKVSGEKCLKCPICNGLWITKEAFESIEESSDDEGVKVQRQYGTHPVDHKCPHCKKNMNRFRYRGYKLEIESCPTGVGFWLDTKESNEIQKLIKHRSRNLHRSAAAERQWGNARRGVRPGIIQKLKTFFGLQ